MQISDPTTRLAVFISHRMADSDLALRLAEDLKSQGFIVWLDDWEILVGDSIVERINSGMDHAKYVILCYSDSGVLSPWMSREWMSSLARQLNGNGIKLLPARLSGGSPPAILADVKCADLVKDWSRGVSDLVKAMR